MLSAVTLSVTPVPTSTDALCFTLQSSIENRNAVQRDIDNDGGW